MFHRNSITETLTVSLLFCMLSNSQGFLSSPSSEYGMMQRVSTRSKTGMMGTSVNMVPSASHGWLLGGHVQETIASSMFCHHFGMGSCRSFGVLRMSSTANEQTSGGRGGREREGGRGGGGGGRGRGPPGRGRGGGRGGVGGRGGRGVGGRGGGPPNLKLENPLKVQRIQMDTGRQERDRNDSSGGGGRGDGPGGSREFGRGGGGRGRGGRDNDGGSGRGGRGMISNRGPAAAASNVNSGDDGDIDSSSSKGPARKFGKKKAPSGDFEKKPRNSLRVGTGKNGRSAEKNMSRGSLKKRDRSAEKERKREAAIERSTVFLPEGPLSVSELAELLDEKPVSVIKFLMTDLGIMAGMNQSLDPATCVAVVEGFGMFVSDENMDDLEEVIMQEDESALDAGIAFEDEDPSLLQKRPPVVTIMGHVDHGKTSLLDAIRNTKVTAGEAGGITQHIGAYQVEQNGEKITFIDTPGHAAFTDMRQRGANITDMVILVVAADDGVKQQTADSIACARQAGVPIIVAVNKIDLETANVAKVKTELTQYDILTEDLGGDVLVSEISAKQKLGLDDLLEKVLLQAEVQDLKANPDRLAQGAVIEARIEKGLGCVATTLIQKGTIKVGDIFVAGATSGRVKALIAADGKTRLKEAGPSSPVSVVGFDGKPAAGDLLVVCENEQVARDLAASRSRIAREKEAAAYQAGLMKSVAAAFATDGKFKEQREMCVVVKADVQGSAEALTRALQDLKLENDEAVVTIKVLVSEAGEVSKSDVAIASVTPGTTIIAFNCAANFAATEDARAQNIPIEYYSIVYDAIESVECRMQEVLSPTPEGEYVGEVVVQEVFNIGGVGNIAGSKCTNGFIKKGSNVRVMRGDKILCEDKIKSLRNFKSEVDKIEAGDECGVGLMTFEDFQPGDRVESYLVQK
eukprot:CAMPEP_0176493662 /NCGR_PEP_ID=MMETSP0200_2-20121128/9667_1 /TAXON_ID=947934 /ORGANISM="Chaetoceros sp., Strain GSL56" /LENGTH=914 /DNA_ID=CAMNT_0017891337 /DNA_START=265 /DNA_END=3009 /DNA_ORIENTATION=+